MPTPPAGRSARTDAVTTQWSQIRQADKADPSAQVARSALVLRYAKAVRSYVGGMIKNQESADELPHEVVARLLKGDFAGADPTRGQFRDVLKTAARNMVRDFLVKRNRRQPVKVDASLVGDSDKAGDPWLDLWQKSVLDHAWRALNDYEKANPRKPAHTLLRLRTDFPGDTADELALKFYKKCGVSLRADMFRQTLHRARLKFAELLVDEIRLGLDDQSPARVEEELAALDLLDHVRDFLPELVNAKTNR